ncbi:hypothetical protein [Paraburkholderia sp. UYCP14C]|nr:hypothetical protein [Paraburkholderia sp. UYCP14C]
MDAGYSFSTNSAGALSVGSSSTFIAFNPALQADALATDGSTA